MGARFLWSYTNDVMGSLDRFTLKIGRGPVTGCKVTGGSL